jgi:hypothetical protein
MGRSVAVEFGLRLALAQKANLDRLLAFLGVLEKHVDVSRQKWIQCSTTGTRTLLVLTSYLKRAREAPTAALWAL